MKRATLFAVVVVLTAAGSATARGATPLHLRVQAEHHQREWETWKGEESFSGLYMPVDLRWKPDRSSRVAAGADLGWFEHEDPAGRARIDGPRNVRLGVDREWWRGRVRAGAGLRASLVTEGLDLAEGRLAEAATEAALDLPPYLAAGGTRFVLQGAAQAWQGRGAGVQVGAAWERRGSYEVMDDERRLEPGDAWALAGSLVLEEEIARHELRLRVQREGASELDGGYRYETGDLAALRAGTRWRPALWDLRGALSFAARGSGSIEAGAPLDPRGLRGGNVFRASASGARLIREAELGLSLSYAAIRGFHGDLGHASWIEPGLFWARRWTGGEVRLSIGLIEGSARGERELKGTRAAVSWTAEVGR